MIEIKAINLTKKYTNAPVFKNKEFFLRSPCSLAVTGCNGSGKSTMLEIIAGLQKPDSGTIAYTIDGADADVLSVHRHMGFSSLKIIPYGELSALENIRFILDEKRLAGKDAAEIVNSLLDQFGLYKDREKPVRFFSSGMKQRLRLIFAILYDPEILILDEPGSNLDRNGKERIYSYIDSVKQNKMVIIATNEKEEAGICEREINLDK